MNKINFIGNRKGNQIIKEDEVSSSRGLWSFALNSKSILAISDLVLKVNRDRFLISKLGFLEIIFLYKKTL